MLWRRTGRPPAAALDRAFTSFLAQVAANGPRDWALSPREDHTLRRHRFFSVSVGGAVSTAAHLGKQPGDPHPVQSWDSSPGFVGPPVGNVLLTPNWGVSTCSCGTMLLRASSTDAAAKRSEERAADGGARDEQNLKEPSAAEKAPVEPEPEGGKPNKTQQLKKVFKEYGAVGVSFHIGISLMSLGMFYLLLSSGMDMTAVLCKLGFSEAVVQSKMAAGTSTFVLAYAIHKLFAPVRISITLVSVPLIVRYCRKTGLFKPPTPVP